MGKSSAISTHPEQAAIDAAILANHETLAALAMRFNVSVHSLSRRKRALAVTVESGADALEQQAAMWRERADTLWHTATADADTRAQAAAIAAGLRSCELMAQEAKRAAANPPLVGEDGSEVVTIEMIDRLVRAELNATPRGRNQSQLYSAPDKVLELAARLADNPQSWGAVESILESTQGVN